MLWQNPVIVTAIMFVIFLEINRSFGWQLIKTSLLIGLLGPIAEIIAISSGAWNYALPQVGGVPIWLFLLWGIAGIFFLSLADILGESVSDKKR